LKREVLKELKVSKAERGSEEKAGFWTREEIRGKTVDNSSLSRKEGILLSVLRQVREEELRAVLIFEKDLEVHKSSKELR